ncbi:MAG: sugar porter family MFS transporter [Candidatus Ancillula sp.]|jgi:sugar porter (SP) family MFS transporter|nr:sugar porter family MFS transporter [Candidatus Ancillula sp.]
MRISSRFIYFFGALGGMLFGYDFGVISGTLHFLDKNLRVTENSLQEGFVAAAVLIGAGIGAIAVGKAADLVGRKKLLIASSIIFCIGALLSGFAFDAFYIVAARILLGLAIGSVSALVPMYLSELAPTSSRGSIAFLNQLMIVLGILLSYVVNFLLVRIGSPEWNTQWGWRFALGGAVIPGFVMLLGSLLLPESPRFLVRIGDLDSARAVLTNLRPVSEVDEEIDVIKANIKTKFGSFKDIFSRFVRPALFVGAGLAFFQQFMGCNIVVYYAPKVLEVAGFNDLNQRLVAIGIGIFNVIATIIAIAIVDKINRRTLLTIGGIVMGISVGVIAWVDYNISGSTVSITEQVVISIMLILYILAFGITWGGTMWVVLGEIFPLHVRGLGVGIASMVNWLANFLVVLLFPVLLGTLGNNKYWIFIGIGLFCLLGVVFVRTVAFETRGLSLEEIETNLQKKAMK